MGSPQLELHRDTKWYRRPELSLEYNALAVWYTLGVSHAAWSQALSSEGNASMTRVMAETCRNSNIGAPFRRRINTSERRYNALWLHLISQTRSGYPVLSFGAATMFTVTRSMRLAAARSGSYAAIPRSLIARNMNTKVNGESETYDLCNILMNLFYRPRHWN